jgi:PleD family two-component response regulator
MQLISSLENEFDIVCAIDGNDCLDQASMVQPDILLLDDMATDPSCYEICHTLKENVMTQDITVILLSDLMPEELETEVPLVGANDYICRPINSTLMIEKLM